MRVDLKSLGTFNRIGTDGAEKAANALSTLTGCPTDVETTGIHFGRSPDVETLLGEDSTRVAIEFDGAIEGRALLVFDTESTTYILENLEGVDSDFTHLHEIANILTSSFVDGWATPLADTIDISTPHTLENDEEVLPWDGETADPTFVFHSAIGFGPNDYGCDFYFIPVPVSFLRALRDQIGEYDDLEVDLDELTAFLRLTIAGAETVADQLETMTGMETTVQLSHLDIVPVEVVPESLGPQAYLGTVFQFDGPMDGYLAVLFEESSADDVLREILPGVDENEAMRRSAIEELGNITASGFIDGWANALGTTIDHTVPDFVEDMGRTLLQAIAVRLGQTQDFAYVFDLTVRVGEPVQCRVFSFPDEEGLKRVITSIDRDIDVSSVERL